VSLRIVEGGMCSTTLLASASGVIHAKAREGVNLLAIKKYNDAIRAQEEAEEILKNYKPMFKGDEANTYGKMLGGTNEIAAVQSEFMKSRRDHEAERDRLYAERLRPSSVWASFW